MRFMENVPGLAQFRTPTVRHLAWMCQATQLVSSPLTFPLHHHPPPDTLAKLRHWDASPDDGPAFLTQTAHPRLGLYFEGLYGCLMCELLGWEMLAHNLPIRGEGRTLGELDFILRNPHTKAIEHHEIAVKFYLGYSAPHTPTPLWLGPHAKDRLDSKTQRLLNHQSRLTQRPETAAALEARGIGQPQTTRIFMPGYLFYPPEPDLHPPPHTPADHQRGGWLYQDDVRNKDTRHWVHLVKPHWLGPWSQPEPPSTLETQTALADGLARATPQLFARMERHEASGMWEESKRYFVVPAQWPGF